MTMPGPRGEECRLCYYWDPEEDTDLADAMCVITASAWIVRPGSSWCGEFNPHPEKAEAIYNDYDYDYIMGYRELKSEG
jgi:hypothetical protein